jgi:hypothetical protein
MEKLTLDLGALQSMIEYYVSVVKNIGNSENTEYTTDDLWILDMSILDIYVAQSDMSSDPPPQWDGYHPTEYGSAEWFENEIFEGRHRIV